MMPLLSSLVGLPEHHFLRNETSAPPSGYLADEPWVNAALEGLMAFAPSLWVLLLAPYRIRQMRSSKLVLLPNRRGYAKMILACFLLLLQLVRLCSGAQLSHWPSLSLLTQLLFVARDLAICMLSFLEHGRNVAPSTIITIYLFLETSVDAIHAGLLYVACNLHAVPRLAAASFAARLILLILESQTKKSILREPYADLSPEESSGFIGSLFFWWINKILKIGYTNTLSLSHMPPLGKSLDATEARRAMLEEWERRKKPESRFTLLMAQWKCLWWSNMYVMLPRATLVLLRCCQPLLISRTINFVTKESTSFETRNDAFRLLLFTFIIYTGMALCKSMNERLLARAECLSRMGLVAIIYNDSLMLKGSIVDESAAVTLASNDVENAANFSSLFHDVWSQVLELGIGTYMLADEMGWVCIVPPLVVLATSRSVKYVTDSLGERHMAFSQATQTRISATKAVLDSMKNIKMMGLVEKTEARIQSIREHELSKFARFYRLMVAFFVSSVALSLFSPAVTLIFYAIHAQFWGRKFFDVEMIFTSIAIIDLVSTPANTLLGVMPEAAAVTAAFERIQKYLLAPNLTDKREIMSQDSNNRSTATAALESPSLLSLPAIKIDEATIRPASTADPILHSISTQCNKGDLVVVAGAVGVGKSTLVKAVLGDLQADSGSIKLASRTIAYCSQTPWLINGTIKEVICGPYHAGTSKDEARYKNVMHVCDLQQDLANLPNGDQTMIGSRGVVLSGGQKQRVALARAVFADRDLVILDDVLSALDATTERHIVNKLLGPKGFFKERGSTVILISHAAQHLPLADHIIILDKTGHISEQGSWQTLRNASGYTSKLKLRDVDDGGGGESRDCADARAIAATSMPEQPERIKAIARETSDTTIYMYYFSVIGGHRLLILTSTLTVYAGLQGAIPYWLRWMAESKGERMWFYTSIYLLLTSGAALSVASAVGTIFLIVAPHAGRILHASLLHTVMHAPPTFFSVTDTGTTLSRFSADMSIIDRSLPFALFQVLQSVFLLLSQCILLGSVQPLIIATLPFTIAAVYAIQKVYLKTSKQLRFIDLEARALVNTDFLETLEGASTIRAFGWQHAFIEKNSSKVDMSMRPDYLLTCIQRWLDLVLDLIVPGLALTIIGLAIALKGTTTGGQVGIALNVVLKANRYILRLINAFAKLETSLGAISRLRAFENEVQPEETPGMVNSAPASWPSSGLIELENFSAQYNETALVLRDINISIAAGTKVGVVGRTGSGKSSLLLSLLRLVDACGEGTTRIDGLNISDLPRNFVRSRIITVPQDPMLVQTSTLRQNLDITDANIPDADIVAVLEHVGLWASLLARGADVVAKSDSSSDDSCSEAADDSDNGALPEDRADMASSTLLSLPMKKLPLSQGQQQLLSLARALLMRPFRGRVVLLDEATSNVDAETDKVMQTIVRGQFKDHTVITVAHRLETIMDSDVVLVLSGGRLAEVGTPAELSVKENGALRALLFGEN